MKRTAHIHIPRTAGSAVRIAVKATVDSFQDLRFGRPCDPSVSHTYMGHQEAGFMIGEGIVSSEWWDGCYKYTFVRNTWDRLVSLYEHLRRIRGERNPSYDCLVDFGTFITAITSPETRWKYLLPIMDRPSRLNQAHSQLEWLRHGVDFVGRYERLDEDWKRLCGIIGIEHRTLLWKPLHRERHETQGDYRDYYTPDTRRMVADVYAEEIAEFGFVFGEEA